MSEVNEENKEKCFVIMPISDQEGYLVGHFTKVYEQIIRPSVEEAGYEAYRVDENTICDTIMNKIFSAIQECPMAVCDLSGRNPNVLYELGLRQAYDKPVVLIQDDKTEKIFDVSGISTVFYNSARTYEDVIKAREEIKKAIIATKEGKANTLAKVMKVNAADFSMVEASKDDKTNVMLEGIYDKIKELNNNMQEGYPYSITADPQNGITLYNNNDIEKGTILNITVEYENSKQLNRFIDAVTSNTIGLITFENKKISENMMVFKFIFSSKEACRMEFNHIIVRAHNLDIDIIENYTI